MSPIDLREFGRLEEKVEAQGRQIENMSEKLDALLALANQSRGGFWVGMSLVSMASAAVGWAASWFAR